MTSPSDLNEELANEIYGPLMETAVKDLTSLDSAVSRVKGLESRRAAAKAVADEWREKIAAWERKEYEAIDSKIDWLMGEMAPYVRDVIGAGKKRSVDTPSGVVGFRSPPERVEVEDEPRAITHLKAVAPQAVVVKESIDKRAAKKLLDEGVEIPGLSIVRGEDRIYVK